MFMYQSTVLFALKHARGSMEGRFQTFLLGNIDER